MHKRVLITGAAGFIGSHLADHYIDQGAAVYGIDDLTTGDWDNFPIREAHYLEASVVERREFYAAANRFQPDLIFHCAASYSDPMKWHRDAETNVLGSINAAIVAAHHGAKLVYFNTALPPISSYAISKIAGEQYIRQSAAEHLICRLANIYGPRNLSGPIPTFYKRLMAEEPCTVVQTYREMVYVGDLIEAVTMFVAQEVTGTIDICSGHPVSIRELYYAVAAELGVDAEAEEVEPGSDDVAMMELNPLPAAAKGWHPTVSLQKGVRAAVDWYRAHEPAATYTHLRSR